MNTTTSGSSTPTFSAKTDFITGTGPYAIAIGDLNGDGLPDVAATNYDATSVSVFFNTTPSGNATPTFSAKTDFTTGTNPASISFCDFNGDGKPDIVIANYGSNTVSVLFNTTTSGSATPTFSAKTDFTTGTGPYSVAMGDFNGDGKKDIATANYDGASTSIFLNTTTPGSATPTFSAKTDFTAGTNPASVAIRDLNGDGVPDLAVANYGSNSVSVFFNTTTPNASTPTFSANTDFATESGPYAVALGDFNCDGRPDMAATNYTTNKISVYFNITTPGASAPAFSSASNYTVGTAPSSVTFCDLNGDGKPDMSAGNETTNNVSVFMNTMTLGVTPVSFSGRSDYTAGTAPRYISTGDFNGDGKPDLVDANSTSNSVSIFLNTTTPGASSPSFSPKTDFTTGTTPQSVVIGDFNGDGKPDLVTANNGALSVSVLLNTTTPGASTPTFSAKTDFTTGSLPRGVSIGDFNGDGKPDLAVANNTATSVSVFLNTTTTGASTPTFSAKTDFTAGTNPVSASIGDFNGDGKLDLAVVNNGSTSVSVFLNTTTPGASIPTFSSKTDFTTATQPNMGSVGDFNGDGKPDLVIANAFTGVVSVLLNTTTPGASTPSFSAKTDFTTAGLSNLVSICDLNGDGKQDMVSANSGAGINSVSVLLNTTTPGASTPTFDSKTDFTGGTRPNGVSFGDFNGDGKPDMALANNNSVLVLFTTGANAQISTNGSSGLSATYPNLASAVTALNGATIVAPVVISVNAGNPQTAPAGGYSITATGTASNTITFTGNGNTITASASLTAGALNDGIFKLIGSDYVTIQGFTMQENAANITTAAASNNMTEWGVALLYNSITDGAKNNIIQNNTISLNRIYSNTFGIYSNVQHSSTAVTTSANITLATGSNSGNKIYGNSISNVDYGIVFEGSFTAAAMDSGNDIGGSSLSTANTITNWGGLVSGVISGYVSVTTMNSGIYMDHQINDNVSFNTLSSATNITTITTVGFWGIYKNYSSGQPVGTFTSNYNNNTVTLNNTAATSSTMTGMGMQGLYTAVSTATFNCNNNNILNCSNTGASMTFGNMTGMSHSSSVGTFNITGNTIRGFTSQASSSGRFTGIELQSPGVVNALNITNNNIGDGIAGAVNFTAATHSGFSSGISIGSGTSSTCALTITGNNLQGITHTAATPSG
ncbi:unnamed protein product, partial [Rotaria sp. Silwood1]